MLLTMPACSSLEGEAKALMPFHDRPTVTSPGQSVADGHILSDAPLSPFDDAHPALTKLEPELRAALRRAAADAQADDVRMAVNSGWRSVQYQQVLLDDAARIYGSETEARRWVNTPEKSTHVSGRAVDIGPTDADNWLSQHGASYGLCQTYANEMWHFELATVPGGTCPAPAEDASSG
ncbi:hypothetical protein B2J88_42845 [Rhodococcus sp. SRB_17]|nr:hypothetical protein [Rhodococcus sp. SRB_17]